VQLRQTLVSLNPYPELQTSQTRFPLSLVHLAQFKAQVLQVLLILSRTQPDWHLRQLELPTIWLSAHSMQPSEQTKHFLSTVLWNKPSGQTHFPSLGSVIHSIEQVKQVVSLEQMLQPSIFEEQRGQLFLLSRKWKVLHNLHSGTVRSIKEGAQDKQPSIIEHSAQIFVLKNVPLGQ
jgi:hypothetical protein